MPRRDYAIVKRDYSIVEGSIADVAARENIGLEEALMGAKVIVILDVSGSMDTPDAGEGMRRHDRAEIDLRRIQGEYPGQVALICFSSDVVFCPTGVPDRMNSMTDMARALEFVFPFDGTDTRFYLISDGEPNDEESTLRVARRFKTPISTIYIGPHDATWAIEFLKRLSSLTGGRHVDADKIAELYDPAKRFLLQDGV